MPTSRQALGTLSHLIVCASLDHLTVLSLSWRGVDTGKAPGPDFGALVPFSGSVDMGETGRFLAALILSFGLKVVAHDVCEFQE